jgi:hypothetical protein
MAKKSYNYSKEQLQSAIRKVEVEQKPKNHSELWKLVADEYNKTNHPVKAMQAPTARSRAMEWGLEISAPKGERGRPKKPFDAEKAPIQKSKPQAYDEPSRGRKPCQSCGKYYGIRLDNCPACGVQYVKQEKPQEIKTYPGPGRRRKQCPKCKVYLGMSAEVCVCGYEFSGNEDVPSPTSSVSVKIYDEDGPKRKQCPECNKFVGHSTKECVCGHQFEEIVKKTKVSDRFSLPSRQEVEATRAARLCGCSCRIVVTPTGQSPVKLNDAEKESVVSWHDKVIEFGHSNDIHYGPSALRYFLAYYHFDRNSEEYAKACEVINDIYSSQSSEGEEEIEE